MCTHALAKIRCFAVLILPEEQTVYEKAEEAPAGAAAETPGAGRDCFVCEAAGDERVDELIESDERLLHR
ncbi:hypothetical protein [Limisalsivibrio acetivorans]|uniref:hypothetical protein n=1 Tax=Limisalsivibrio acetivorans TaxID=1304888 RepID=UPI0012DE9047|nr:hypothetical protein [Limisalsivibrio acetivorans]